MRTPLVEPAERGRLDIHPATVRTVVEAVRTAVADELGRLAGHRMRTLAVTVTGMRGPSAPAPARLR